MYSVDINVTVVKGTINTVDILLCVFFLIFTYFCVYLSLKTRYYFAYILLIIPTKSFIHSTLRFEGQRCQDDKSPCKVQPCINGGKCIELNITSFNCSCRGGYTGPFCGVDIDECASSPCPLHSNCINKLNNYSCICHKSHTGKDCEIGKIL